MSSQNQNHKIWSYFDISDDDEKYAVCGTCKVKISRGAIGRKATNSAMIVHLKGKHLS